jgi:hypothetical protein
MKKEEYFQASVERRMNSRLSPEHVNTKQKFKQLKRLN